jgi:hypothetical protein
MNTKAPLQTSRVPGNIDINRNAPVQAECTILIRAEPEIVWKLLTDINRWPMWIDTVSDAYLHNHFGPGTSFTWRSNRINIESVVQYAEPRKILVWSGSLFGIKAIHTWKLETDNRGNTLVTTAESMEGFLAGWLIRSSLLKEILKEWLLNLQDASENR